MARPLRIEFAGALYHITSRGDRREAIYEVDEDRVVFLSVLAEVAERYHWICHAFCLMTNHYHLVIETVEGNLSQGMRHLNGVYTQVTVHPPNTVKKQDVAWVNIWIICLIITNIVRLLYKSRFFVCLLINSHVCNLLFLLKIGGVNGYILRHRIGVTIEAGICSKAVFKGILVDKDAYLLELSRYVVLNPVRAGMVETWVSGLAITHRPLPLSLSLGSLLSSPRRMW